MFSHWTTNGYLWCHRCVWRCVICTRKRESSTATWHQATSCWGRRTKSPSVSVSHESICIIKDGCRVSIFFHYTDNKWKHTGYKVIVWWLTSFGATFCPTGVWWQRDQDSVNHNVPTHFYGIKWLIISKKTFEGLWISTKSWLRMFAIARCIDFPEAALCLKLTLAWRSRSRRTASWRQWWEPSFTPGEEIHSEHPAALKINGCPDRKPSLVPIPSTGAANVSL